MNPRWRSTGHPSGPVLSWPRRMLRRTLLLCVTMATVILMLALFQRSLVYQPSREERLQAASAGLPVGRVHDIAVQSDGVTLHGWHFLPANAKANDESARRGLLAQARRVVIYFSGNAGHRGYRVDDAELLNRLDCHVFLFDYRGYGDNEGSPSEEALARDARRIWSHLTEELEVPRQKILLFGESLGGGVAVRLAAELCEAGEEPGGLVLRATFSSLVDVAAWHFPWIPVRWLLVDRYPSDARITRVTCPILHFHGMRDTIVPTSLGRKLFAAAPTHSSTGMEKRFVELPESDHNDVLEKSGGRIQRLLTAWMGDLESLPLAPQVPPASSSTPQATSASISEPGEIRGNRVDVDGDRDASHGCGCVVVPVSLRATQ